MIFPCIDLMNGKVVQLVQGKKKAIELCNPIKIVKKFNVFTIQVIDLDAAMGKGNNLEIIKLICKISNVRVGGGIRTIDRALEIIDMGAKKVIVSSAVFKENKIDYGFLKKLNSAVSKERIIIAVDSFKGKIVIGGWKKKLLLKPEDVIKKLEPYCSEFLHTYVDKEGLMEGTNIDFVKKLRALTQNEITIAGGISSIEEIKKLEDIGVNSALGMALYTGKIKLEELKKFFTN